jgi:hypothetical protein
VVRLRSATSERWKARERTASRQTRRKVVKMATLRRTIPFAAQTALIHEEEVN